MADSRPGCTNVFLIAAVVLLGAIVGAVIGGLSGFIFGGVLGYVLLRQTDLRRRLKSVEEAQRWTKGFPTSEPAAPLPPPLVPPAVPPSSPPPPPPAPPQAGREPVPFEAPSVTEPVAHVAQPPAPPATPLEVPTAQRADDRHVQAEPSLDSANTLANTLKTWVTTGNVPVKVGVLVSLVGLGFLIQEANERGFITLTIEMGLIAVALFGLALLAIGWRLRRTHTIYGLSLQGGGIAALYLTTYAAFAVYDVLEALPGGSAVIVITVGAGVLAVVQDARSLAVLGIIGGFLAPVLVYTQPEDHLALFGFYTVLSAAIVGVAWFKVWPELNLLGLAFTFGISAFWLWDRYSTDDWASTQPLIAILVLLYMAIPVLFAIREVPDIEDPWIAPLVFGTPFMGFGLQYLAIGHTEYGLAISALLLAVAQGALTLIARRLDSEQGQLAAAYTGLAVTFLALAVPFALNAHYTSTVWALQGTLLVWFGCRRERVLAIDGGLLLQFLAGLSFMVHLDHLGFSLYPEDTLPIVNEHFLGACGARGRWFGVGLAAVPGQGSCEHRQRRASAGVGLGNWLVDSRRTLRNRLPTWDWASVCGAGLRRGFLRYGDLAVPSVAVAPTRHVGAWDSSDHGSGADHLAGQPVPSARVIRMGSLAAVVDRPLWVSAPARERVQSARCGVARRRLLATCRAGRSRGPLAGRSLRE